MNYIRTEIDDEDITNYIYKEGIFRLIPHMEVVIFKNENGTGVTYFPSSGFRLFDTDYKFTQIDYLGDYPEDKMFQEAMLYDAYLIREVQEEILRIRKLDTTTT
ncbi:hypothetical protein N7621_000137 [Salmonella enterica]|uniref:Uncharacterized protein n=1 Tax=Salmonella enterica I TaxID=59201 RepID=A0A3U4W9F8_SALET|nr:MULTISPECIES: hypothetical protein [Salmonella]EDR7495887.1 hypothetical protein [Salmonella enterica subsp. enterica serovar Kiambu]EDX2778727.1 hypothetical protein [Salmonella enterica subsp. enterica serovar 4,12:nonmotile]KNB32034.1 hypothetical protein ACH55_05055 [Salmonella enterica subsp. enterica serovar Typhimurium]RXY94094.1 hypothetical protein DD607_06520 [Salmonella sp. 3DZ2-4SM]ASN55794.1 hypothetical protein CGL53_08850 [Salmonella enterica subsp. enterica serovar Indiana]